MIEEHESEIVRLTNYKNNYPIDKLKFINDHLNLPSDEYRELTLLREKIKKIDGYLIKLMDIDKFQRDDLSMLRDITDVNKILTK